MRYNYINIIMAINIIEGKINGKRKTTVEVNISEEYSLGLFN